MASGKREPRATVRCPDCRGDGWLVPKFSPRVLVNCARGNADIWRKPRRQPKGDE